MSVSLLWTVVVAIVLFGFIVSLVSNIYAALFDLRAKQPKKALEDHEKRSLTILIPAYNESPVIERCIKSVESLKYSNFRIIVIDDASTDNTSQIVRKHFKNTDKKYRRLITLRKNRGKGGAMNYALKKYVDTDVTMVLDADCTIHPDAVKHIMQKFRIPAVAGVASNVRIAEDLSILSYLQKIEFMLGFRAKRSFDAANAEFIVGGQGATYLTETIKQVGGFKSNMQTEDIALSLAVLTNQKNIANRLMFASDSLVYTEAVPNLKGLFKQRYRWKFGALQAVLHYKKHVFKKNHRVSNLLKWYRIPQLFAGELMALFEPLIIVLLVMASLYQNSILPLLGGWISFTIYLITVISIDEHTSKKVRLRLCLLSPFLFPFFYVFSAINFLGMLKVIRNWRQLLNIDLVSGSWVSPIRIGKTTLPH